MRTLRIALVSLLILVVTGSVQSATIRVPEDYPTIQAGIDAAEKDDVVLVADGTYVENLNFLGKAITVESASGNPALCIIYGNKRDPVVTFGSGEGAGSILRGFRIQDGGGDEGGGILCSKSSPTIANNIVTRNGAYYYGGGIRCTDNSSPIIINNVISQNNARYGGGIHCTGNSSPIICHNTIMGNRADETGSGIYCYTSSATIVNTILWNYALSEIHQSHSSIEVTYSVVRGGYPGVGNIDEYPHFVGLDDYHLSDYSPCIGAGIMTQDVPNTDIEGNPRPYPDGSNPDMGAYESNRGVPLPPPARRTIHISTTGSDDTGDGSSGNPYLTIQKGIDEAFDGDTVLVADGTYVENLTFHGKAITVESASSNSDSCIIDGSSEGNVVFFDSGEDTDSVLRGFTIQNGKQGTYCLNSSPTIASNMVTGNLGAGISCYNSSPTISNNVVMENEAGWPGGAGIYCTENSSPIIVSNIIVGNKANHTNGGGICCTGNSSSIIISNVVAGNEAEYGGGIYCSDDCSPIISNNTILGNRADDIGGGLFCPTSSTVVINTILWDNMPQEISPGDGSISVTYSNVRGGYPGVGNINEYPRFVSANDYHLSDYSPCIGVGMMTQDVPDRDIEGNPRPNPVGSAPDIGAYENSLSQALPHSTITVHVSTTGSDETGDGSPDNPYLTIQKGIDVAFDGDTVLVADGTYMENLTFHGKAITVQSASGNPELCIIDAGGKDSVVTFRSSEGADSMLRGFTIQNGRAQNGGGVYCHNSSPIISSNIIKENRADYIYSSFQSNGGGICCYNSSPIIDNNVVVGNRSAGSGG